MALRGTEMHEDAARDSRKPVAPAILSPVFLSNPNRVFNGVTMALRATEMHEDAARDSRKPGSAGDLVAGVRTNRVFNGTFASVIS
jgi:hypothetical protein